MRVLFVHERAGFLGGVEQNIAQAAVGLRARGHDCLLAYGTEGHDEADFLARFERSWRAAELGAPVDGDRRSLAEVIAEAVPDVLYLHRVPTVQAVAPWLGRVRAVRMVHDHDLCCPRRHKYYAWTGRVCDHPAGWRCWADLAFIARAREAPMGVRYVSLAAHRTEIARHGAIDALLVGSRSMRSELLSNGLPAGRVHILPPVVPEEGVTPTPVPAEPRILYVGQLIRGKGVDLLLSAMARLEVPFMATIVGAGNAGDRLRSEAVRLGLADRVSFAGWVDHSQLTRHYEAARLLAVPSRWPEPFGMIGLEAMRHGRPTVGFAVGGIPDWLIDGETGLLAPEQDVAAFARCLHRLLTDHALATDLGQRAGIVVATRFGFDRYLDHLEHHLAGRDAPLWYPSADAGGQ